MARLNDPPAPMAESIDALKRRFIRQNRDLARTNSNQSQRIRNLETEISRLLAENIAIREQAINFAADAERWRTSSGLGSEVIAMKERLTSKMQEVNQILEELGTLPQKATQRSNPNRRKSSLAHENNRSPNERDWRNRQTLGGVLNVERELQEGKLPAILEDKYYPRRTLEVSEIRLLAEEANNDKQDTESPDLGPPPVAHFEVTDAIAFDSKKSPKRVSGGIILNDEEDVLTLPANLETRRKRRTSSLLQDMSGNQEETTEASKPSDTVPSLKSGAKRKLDISQLEESAAPPPQTDDFVFQRKVMTIPNRAKPSRFTRPQQGREQENRLVSETKSPQKLPEPTRRVLGAKSTNSPTKRQVGATLDKKNLEKDNPPGDGNKPMRYSTNERNRPPLRFNVPLDADTAIAEISNIPKTPAPELGDLLSPSTVPTDPSNRSEAIVRSEIAITNSVEDVLNGSIGRGSRRARPAMSYAEPNLRDKMRRPDKKLVGAVEGLSKRELSREPSIGVSEGEIVQTSTRGGEIVKVKNEATLSEEYNENWKNLPIAEQVPSAEGDVASPLRDKQLKQLTVRPVDTRHKRTISEIEEDVKSTGVRHKDGRNKDQNAQQRSIFDPPSSSPLSNNLKSDDTSQESRQHSVTTWSRKPDASSGEGRTVATVKPRRNSVQPQSSSINPAISNQATQSDKSLVRLASSASIRETKSANRDVSSTNLRRTNSTTTLANVPNSAHSHTRMPSKSMLTTTTEDNTDAETSNGAARTMSTRRRSMMV